MSCRPPRRACQAAFAAGAFGATILAAGDLAIGQVRTRSAIPGRVTEEAVVRGLSVVPSDAGGRVEASVMLNIEFRFDSADLTSSARDDLNRVAAALTDARLADGLVTIEGHTDASGSEEYNRRLSRQRATAVTDYLVQRGVAAFRLTAVGFGEERLLTEYEPTDGRQRRVEIVRTW